MQDEIRKLRAAPARRESGRGKRFAPELRRLIGVDPVSWTVRRLGSGRRLVFPFVADRGLVLQG